jgi:hypothetical protein
VASCEVPAMRVLPFLVALVLAMSSGCLDSGSEDSPPGPSPDLGADTPDPSAAAPADVSIQERPALLAGLEAVTWRFDVAAGGTGHVLVEARDMATDEAAFGPDVCLTWEIDGPGGYEEGYAGSYCTSSNVNLVLTLPVSPPPRGYIDWKVLREGSYAITAEALPQPNDLVVDIVVDNP